MIETVTDIKGRKIEFRPLGVLDQARLLRMIGRVNPMDAQNQPYVQMVQFAAMVQSYDGHPVPNIAVPDHIEPAIDKLGDDGYLAMNVWFTHQMKIAEQAAADAAAAGVTKRPLDDAKNSQGTLGSETPAG